MIRDPSNIFGDDESIHTKTEGKIMHHVLMTS